MKKLVIFAVLAAVTATLVYGAYGTRSPGEARREWRERRSKVGEAGDESAEAQLKRSSSPRRDRRPASCCPARTAPRSRR